MKSFLRRFSSYILPSKIHSIQSESGQGLEIWMINGNLVLDAHGANYSFGALHQVMMSSLKKSNFQLDDDKSLLLLGLGAGSVISIVRKTFASRIAIDAVELDAEVIQIAQQYFHLSNYSNVKIIHDDALNYISSPQKKYDFIIIDIFVGSEVPKPFLESSFLQQVKNQLLPGGGLIFNTMLANDKEKLSKFEGNFKKIYPIYEKLKSGSENLVFIVKRT